MNYVGTSLLGLSNPLDVCNLLPQEMAASPSLAVEILLM